MPRKYQPKDIHKQRAENYAFLFSERQRFLALPEETRALLVSLSRHFNIPSLNVMGNFEGDVLDAAFKVGRANGVDFSLCNLLIPIYTDGGWEAFQELWKALPEPIEFVHMAVENWPVVHRLKDFDRVENVFHK